MIWDSSNLLMRKVGETNIFPSEMLIARLDERGTCDVLRD